MEVAPQPFQLELLLLVLERHCVDRSPGFVDPQLSHLLLIQLQQRLFAQQLWQGIDDRPRRQRQ